MYIVARLILYWVTHFPRYFSVAISFTTLVVGYITVPNIEPFSFKVLMAIGYFVVFNISLISSFFKLFKIQVPFEEVLNYYKEVEDIDKGVIHFEFLNENDKFTHTEVLVFSGSSLEKALENPKCPFKKLTSIPS